jgi:hypothetical protein
MSFESFCKTFLKGNEAENTLEFQEQFVYAFKLFNKFDPKTKPILWGIIVVQL